MNEFDFENLSNIEAKYDEMFLSILQKEGKIEPFLDSVFKFLYRRTDFFLIQESENQPYGFPKNVANQIVNKIFKKYDSIPKEKLKQRLLETNRDLSQAKPNISTSISKSIEKQTNQVISKKPEEKADIKKQQEMFQKNPSSYNGAMRDNYSWTQTIKDIDIRVKINTSIKSGKDVKVKYDKDSLQVSIKDETNCWKYLIDDNLAWKIKPDECTWSIFPGDHIHIYLEKVQERWWENLLANEEKIDLKNINPEKPMEDLDEESQAKIKQMMYDEQQKRLGLPTSEEQKKVDILAKAWNAEGSPFKGTPFDPSVILNNNQ